MQLMQSSACPMNGLVLPNRACVLHAAGARAWLSVLPDADSHAAAAVYCITPPSLQRSVQESPAPPAPGALPVARPCLH